MDIKLPRYFDLFDYVKQMLHDSVSEYVHPEIQAFLQRNNINRLAVETRCVELEKDGKWEDCLFRLGVKFDRNIGTIVPLGEKELAWLEDWLGAILSLESTDQYDGGGGYLYYSMHMPTAARLCAMNPKWPFGAHWTGGGWVTDDADLDNKIVSDEKKQIQHVIEMVNDMQGKVRLTTEEIRMPDIRQHEESAADNADRSRECGDVYYYGREYMCGHGQMDQDYAKARKYYSQAVDLGDAKSAEMLISMDLEPGNDPTPWADMVHWAKTGAELGSKLCAMHMGNWTSRGVAGFVERDLLESLQWFSRAYHLSTSEVERENVVAEVRERTGMDLLLFLK